MTATVNDQSITITDESLTVSESVGIYECDFTFDASWDEWNKTAVFEGAGATIEMIIVDNKAQIPWEVLKEAGWIKIGVYGTKGGEVKPTIWSDQIYVAAGTVPESVEVTPTPSIYAQILDLANDAKDIAEDAQDTADDVASDWANVSATATTLSAGSPATVTFTDNTFTFGIPKGAKGDTGATGATGATPDFSIGTVSTLETGQSATATITGTAAEPVLNLGLPKGNKGDNGDVANIADAYSTSATYAVGDYCIYSSQLYRCTTAITTAEAWTAAHWSAVELGEDVSTLRSALTSVESALDIKETHWEGTKNPYGVGNWVRIVEGLQLKKDVTYKMTISTETAPSGNISWIYGTSADGSPASTTIITGTLTTANHSNTYYYTPTQDLYGVNVRVYAPQVNISVDVTVDSNESSSNIEDINKRIDNLYGIFNDVNGAEYTELLTKLVRKIYIPDNTLANNLRLASVYKASNTGTRYIRLYAYISGTLTLMYESSSAQAFVISPGIEVVQLIRANNLSGYALIDWTVLEDGASYSNLISNKYILSDSCYDIKNAPEICDALFWQNNYIGKRLSIEKLLAGEVRGNVYEIPHNYDVPINKTAFYLSSDIGETYETDTDAKRIRSLTPYLYFYGQKIGTFVMFDDNGDPYIIDKNGNTKHITVV